MGKSVKNEKCLKNLQKSAKKSNDCKKKMKKMWKKVLK